MNIAKGGRGHKAPYKTTHIRVPENIKFLADFLSHQYKDYVANTGKTDIDKNLLTSLENFFDTGLENNLNYLQEIVAERDSYKVGSRNWKVLDKLVKKLRVDN